MPKPAAPTDRDGFLSEELRAAIRQGLQVQGTLADSKLGRQKLTLTQGGEPTFVPHDVSLPEWNVAALGEDKLLYAKRLARQLAQTAFDGGVVLQSFGKQYPGEPLPRWQLGVYRRRKGAPVWEDLSRLRLERSAEGKLAPDVEHQFIEALGSALNLRTAPAIPAHEDVEALIRGGKMPELARWQPRFCRERHAFQTPPISKRAQARLAPLLRPAGWVLPLEHIGGSWRTERWKGAAARGLTLIPGDSPVGLRLPMSRLSAKRVHCALTVERRAGELVVFLPPCATLDSFFELVAGVEETAARLKLPPLRLEGYAPPSDPELEWITLSSDPGVIEVNLPPSDNWADFERVTLAVHEAAAAVGLRGFKLHHNGQTVSTGGGAHILLGGPSLDDNPFVKRPDLLASFLRFFQNHPCLSRVFTGLFTGPSCQAPRVDEGAFDLPQELEITLHALEAMKPPADPSMIDSLLRNLLLDWNGNTHRAEISVDKFCNANAPNGRLGLVEFRAFEMMPAAEMFLAPNALLRALAAAFAESPYGEPLKDWRGALCDQFALPWFLREDLKNVLRFLRGHGFSFQPVWFEPHFDFRFRIITRFTTGVVSWTLRHAIEPWPVMGNHLGTGRIVDASTERLELLAEGWEPGASLVASVNGIRIPLKPRRGGVAVGGIRYRAFDNPFGLQPHIKSHAPLRFEIIDAQRKRVLHCFGYQDWAEVENGNAGLPRTREEARLRADRRHVVLPTSRRQARWREGQTSPRAPLTLDLRRH